jgi:glutathione S-transferase
MTETRKVAAILAADVSAGWPARAKIASWRDSRVLAAMSSTRRWLLKSFAWRQKSRLDDHSANRSRSMLKLYGNPLSRTERCLWMLEEMGEPYELVQTSVRTDDLQNPAYLKLNPNARIPTLVDGEVVIWESMAINLYLAQRPGPMQLDGAAELGLAAQWSFWAMLETEALLLNLLTHSVLLVEHVRDPSHVERNTLLLQRPLAVLNDALAGRDWLAAKSFSVADLNVASLLAWGRASRLDLSGYPSVQRWLEKCLMRPPCRRVSVMKYR